MFKLFIRILQFLYLCLGVYLFARSVYVAYLGYGTNSAIISLIAGLFALVLAIGMVALLSRRMPRKKRG